VVWQAGPTYAGVGSTCNPVDCDIYAWKGGAVQRLTDNAILDVVPTVAQGGAVWIGRDRGPDAGAGLEVFYYSLAEPEPVPSIGPAGRVFAILMFAALGARSQRSSLEARS
jgi:hypothetical protein